MANNESSLMVISGGNEVTAVQPILSNYQVSRYSSSKISSRDFPSDFVWGSATSAYQVEGAYAEGGKSLSNWDVFSLTTPGKISDGSNGCVAIDQYHNYQEDVLLIKKLGLDAYRFSIAWSRVLPGGRLSTGVNKEGIKYYNDLIDFCLAQGVEPYVTIFHWDVPQCLEYEYGGFLSPRILRDFVEFAEVCFWEFGDRVKYWITLNEPWTFTVNGYVEGSFPPAHGSTTPQPVKTGIISHRCPAGRSNQISSDGDPSTEPYIVGHHLILAHALAVDVYRRNFHAVQGGKIGVTNVSKWFDPLNEDCQEDKDAASRAVDFMWGWFVAPVVTGDYPPVMRKLVGCRLPQFTPEQEKLVKGSFDFLGFNYYTTNYAAYAPTPVCTNLTYFTDQHVAFSTERDGMPIGPKGGSDWMYIVPHGIYRLLVHTKNAYNDPLIYITENGVDEVNDKSLTVTEARIDEMRVKFHQDHLFYVKKAMDDGVNVKAYFLWSMFDNYEWAEGYAVRFGIFYIDFVNGLTRYPKTSAIWWMNFLNKKHVVGKKRQIEETEDYNSVKRQK